MNRTPEQRIDWLRKCRETFLAAVEQITPADSHEQNSVEIVRGVYDLIDMIDAGRRVFVHEYEGSLGHIAFRSHDAAITSALNGSITVDGKKADRVIEFAEVKR